MIKREGEGERGRFEKRGRDTEGSSMRERSNEQVRER